MKKSAFVSVRIDRNLKAQAEKILNSLGISPALAIIILYESIIYTQS